MSFPLSTLKTAVQAYCVAATGLADNKVIFAYQGGTEPTGSYVSIVPILGIKKHGIYDEQVTEDNADVTTVRRRSVTLQINAYGPDAPVLITAIQDGLDVSTLYQTFRDSNLNAMFSSDVRNLTAVKNIRYEQSYNIDLVVSVVYTDTELADDIGWFNTIRASTSTLSPQLGEITITGA